MLRLMEKKLSPVVISTALGLGGQGIFPYTLWPAYLRLIKAVRETGAAVLTKSATRHPRQGNFIPANPLTWKYIQRLPGCGMLNAYGLTNKGVEAAAPRIKKACEAGLNVIPNLYPEFAKGTETAVRETLEAAGISEGFRSGFLGPGAELFLPQLRGGDPGKRGPGPDMQPGGAPTVPRPLPYRQNQHLPPLRIRPATGELGGERHPRGQHHPL